MLGPGVDEAQLNGTYPVLDITGQRATQRP
jgi:hypothetical protein